MPISAIAACVSVPPAGLPRPSCKCRPTPSHGSASPTGTEARRSHRPFCSKCGTPLGFAFLDGGKDMDLTVGSFDDPSGFVPIVHSGVESLHEAWLDTTALPRLRTAEIESVASRWKAAGQEVPE